VDAPPKLSVCDARAWLATECNRMHKHAKS
jgi:hypothetical protein